MKPNLLQKLHQVFHAENLFLHELVQTLRENPKIGKSEFAPITSFHLELHIIRLLFL